MHVSRDLTLSLYLEYAPSVADREETEEERKMKWKTAFQEDRFSPAPSDFSLPRRPKRQRHDSPDLQSIDLSPPRRQQKRHDSPEVGDLSPPRRQRTRHDSLETRSPDLSPPRRTRHDSPDLSPPRQSSTLHSNGASPDLSPPRRQRNDSSGSDLSPPRRGSNKPNRDLSPPRRKKRPDSRSSVRQRPSSPEILGPSKSSKTGRHNSGSTDLSPPRRGQQKTPNFSPPRRSNTSGSKTLSGTSAGLQTAEVLRDEILEARREREKFFKEMDSEISGRKAETVYRKDGVKLDPRLERIKKRKEEMKKMEEDEQFMQWGRG